MSSMKNCRVFQSEAGNLYIGHSTDNVSRLLAKKDDLTEDWRKRLVRCEGEYGVYYRVAKAPLKELDV